MMECTENEVGVGGGYGFRFLRSSSGLASWIEINILVLTKATKARDLDLFP